MSKLDTGLYAAFLWEEGGIFVRFVHQMAGDGHRPGRSEDSR